MINITTRPPGKSRRCRRRSLLDPVTRRPATIPRSRRKACAAGRIAFVHKLLVPRRKTIPCSSASVTARDRPEHYKNKLDRSPSSGPVSASLLNRTRSLHLPSRQALREGEQRIEVKAGLSGRRGCIRAVPARDCPGIAWAERGFALAGTARNGAVHQRRSIALQQIIHGGSLPDASTPHHATQPERTAEPSASHASHDVNSATAPPPVTAHRALPQREAPNAP